MSFSPNSGAEQTSVILSLPPGGEVKCLIHPVSGHVSVLRGNHTVEFEGGSRAKFKSGQSFFQGRMQWHRCINEGQKPTRFLLVITRRMVSVRRRPVN